MANFKAGRLPEIPLRGIFLALGLIAFVFFSEDVYADEEWTGRRIMEEVVKRHEMARYVFEEQTMIMMDFAGNRDVRKIRRFSRVEEDETIKFLLVFDNPPEVRGVALLAIRKKGGDIESSIYMPAFGKKLISNAGENGGGDFLGTDFTVNDLTAEVLSDFRYVRTEDRKISKVSFFVVEAMPLNAKVERSTGYRLRRHFIRQDNLFIIRTDYFDRRGRFLKRQTYHDLKKVDVEMWRANMTLMENHKDRHKTLIKVNRRVFSHDYVPKEMFSPAWLMENRHIQGTEDRLLHSASNRPMGNKARPDDGSPTEELSKKENKEGKD